jgi:hypothetical protein
MKNVRAAAYRTIRTPATVPLTTSRWRRSWLPVDCTNSAGMSSPVTARASWVAWTPAARALNSCSRWPIPPARNDTPSTSKRLPRIEPVSEAFTTSISPLRMRKMAMISSVTLPNVALSNPPMRGPAWSAI